MKPVLAGLGRQRAVTNGGAFEASRLRRALVEDVFIRFIRLIHSQRRREVLFAKILVQNQL